MHDTPRGLWWFLLLQMGPGYFFTELFRVSRNLIAALSSTVSRSPRNETRRLSTSSTSKTSASPHLRVDIKVRALSAMQFSLASAVGEVHRHAGNVATAWGSERIDTDSLRALLHDALNGLLSTLKSVSASKSVLPPAAGREGTRQKMAQSPLSKAVNTEFTSRPSPLGDGKPNALPRLRSTSESTAPINEEGIEAIWQLVHLLEVEGSRASSSAKAVIAANSKPHRRQRRWIIYAALSSAFGSLSLYTIRHSQLCGSSDLDNLLHSVWSSLVRFWNTHAATPWR